MARRLRRLTRKQDEDGLACRADGPKGFSGAAPTCRNELRTAGVVSGCLFSVGVPEGEVRK